MKKISILIIGAGFIAEQHIKSLITIKKVNIIGVYSRSFLKAKKLSKKYRINRVFQKLEEVKNFSENIDIIFLLVNAENTLDVFNKIIQLKKYIFFEKPIGITYSQHLTILKGVKENKIKTFIGFNRRYYSALHKGLKKITSNNKKITSLIIEGHERIWQIKKLSKFKNFISNWPFINSIHNVDLIRMICGEINLKSFNKIQNKDCHACIMKSKSGVAITYISNYDYADSWSVKIYNDNGEILVLKPLEKCSYISKKTQYEIKPNISDLEFKMGFKNMHLSLIRAFQKNKISWPDQDIINSIHTSKLVNKIFYNKKS